MKHIQGYRWEKLRMCCCFASVLLVWMISVQEWDNVSDLRCPGKSLCTIGFAQLAGFPASQWLNSPIKSPGILQVGLFNINDQGTQERETKFAFAHFQDMACDTFLKIVQKCRRKFVILQVRDIFLPRSFSYRRWVLFHILCFVTVLHDVLDWLWGNAWRQVGESEPFVCELLKGLPTTILDLESHQIHTFYEAVRTAR